MQPPSFEYLRPENFNNLDGKQLESLQNLTKFHIDSFDWMLDQGIRHAIKVNKQNKSTNFDELIQIFNLSEYRQSNSKSKTDQKYLIE